MKILFMNLGNIVDYQCDCLLIGLKEMFGENVVDVNKAHHLYTTYSSEDALKLYGKGMTVCRTLPDLEIDRTDIENKIKKKYFDYIIYGSIWRCDDYIRYVMEHYRRYNVVAIDGEDHSKIHKYHYLNHFKILYFKRELFLNVKFNLKPIGFAFPTNKINFIENKKYGFSHITPEDRRTYIYEKEIDYYKDYGTSCFGVTKKKAGWDCLRHYEILGNGCIPYFLNIDECPPNIMTTFPKKLCEQIITRIGPEHKRNRNLDSILTSTYEDMKEDFRTHFLENNTTLKLAEKFINDIRLK